MCSVAEKDIRSRTSGHKVVVMNSINRRAETHQRKSEARSIGNSRYRNLKLKKKEEKDGGREPEALKYRKHSRA